MEVTLLSPIGFCGGVRRALETAKLAKREHPNETIYLLGRLVHDERVLKDLGDQGFVTLDEREKSLEAWLKELKKGSVIVYGAHGHPKGCDEIAKSRGLVSYDATCPFVTKNLREIVKSASQGEMVAYIGQEGHMEAVAALLAAPRATFLYREGAIPKDRKGRKIVAISQTTMSLEDVEAAFANLKKEAPDASLIKSRCLDATKRQAAVSKLAGDVEALIVLGSETSNNSVKLLEKAKRANPSLPAFLLSPGRGLPEDFPKGLKKVALISGASTPDGAIEEAKRYLEAL